MYISFTEFFFFDISNSALLVFAYIAIAAFLAKVLCNYIAANHDIAKAKLATKSNKNK